MLTVGARINHIFTFSSPNHKLIHAHHTAEANTGSKVRGHCQTCGSPLYMLYWYCNSMLANQWKQENSFQFIFLKLSAAFTLRRVAAFQLPPVAYQGAIWQSLIKMLIHFNKRQVINCNYVSSERWQRAGVWRKLAASCLTNQEAATLATPSNPHS